MPRYNRVTTPIPGRPGEWTEELIAYTPEEEALTDQKIQAWADAAPARALADIRTKRDALLAASDFRVLTDVGTSAQRTAWKAYRVLLRDYPATYTADNSAPFPTPVA